MIRHTVEYNGAEKPLRVIMVRMPYSLKVERTQQEVCYHLRVSLELDPFLRGVRWWFDSTYGCN